MISRKTINQLHTHYFEFKIFTESVNTEDIRVIRAPQPVTSHTDATILAMHISCQNINKANPTASEKCEAKKKEGKVVSVLN
jgi:hypothetical protein